MIEIVRLLTRNPSLFAERAGDVELGAALSRLQNALHVLERTLESTESDAPEALSTNTLARK